MGGINERHKEISRRRHRRKKMRVLRRKLQKASSSEKLVIAGKIRKMTTGAEIVIANLGLEER